MARSGGKDTRRDDLGHCFLQVIDPDRQQWQYLDGLMGVFLVTETSELFSVPSVSSVAQDLGLCSNALRVNTFPRAAE